MPLATESRQSVPPKKRLGQHFLTAPYYAERIAQAVPAAPGQPVLEIGPGTGALSVHLQKRFPAFHCVEKDGDVIPALSAKLGAGGHTIHHADALTFDFSKVGSPLHVVGNLPYSVAAFILKKVLLCGNAIASCTCMVQREVAERIAAPPHTKRNGFLSIFCQFFGAPRILFRVPPGAFYPRPDVDSAVFQMLISPDLEARLPRERWGAFFLFVDCGFAQRRKKLVSLLRDGYSAVDVAACFASSGIAPLSRAEDLDVEQWLVLYREAFPW
jgi:16S rRNA (adenine1518-N6/adenine1519-N6)-dimethyltransferase